MPCGRLCKNLLRANVRDCCPVPDCGANHNHRAHVADSHCCAIYRVAHDVTDHCTTNASTDTATNAATNLVAVYSYSNARADCGTRVTDTVPNTSADIGANHWHAHNLGANICANYQHTNNGVTDASAYGSTNKSAHTVADSSAHTAAYGRADDGVAHKHTHRKPHAVQSAQRRGRLCGCSRSPSAEL
jgi:hypothetical protein